MMKVIQEHHCDGKHVHDHGADSDDDESLNSVPSIDFAITRQMSNIEAIRQGAPGGRGDADGEGEGEDPHDDDVCSVDCATIGEGENVATVVTNSTLVAKRVQKVGPGFWNFRGSWMYKGLVNIGSQMSAVQLKSGKFVILDCIELDDELKAVLNNLTNNGTLIEALVLTHPFHVAHLPEFLQLYPHINLYGTPRHLRRFPRLNWKGSVAECRVRSIWYPELDMSIPEGVEFVAPMPEKTNHLNGMFVFHKESRTIHENDTIMIGYHPNIILKLGGYRHLKLAYHQSITNCGLLPSPESPYVFRDWLASITNQWDFDNIAAGHMGCMIGNAKQALQKLIVDSGPMFKSLSKKLKKKGRTEFIANGKFSMNLEVDIFDSSNLTCECG